MNHSIKKITTPKGEVRYQLRVTLGRGIDRKQLTLRFDTKKDAQNYVDDLIHQIADEKKAADDRRARGVTDDEARTWDTELAYWEAHAEPTLSPGNRAAIKGYKSQISAKLSGKSVYEGITDQLLDELVAEYRTPKILGPQMRRGKPVGDGKPRHRKGNSDKTIWNKIGWIQAVLNFSVEKKRLLYSPIAKYEKTKPREAAIEIWDEADAADFLAFADAKYPKGSPKRWVYVAYLTPINTLLRAGEVWALKPRCIQGQDILKITEQFDRVEKDFTPLKGREAFRNVPLNAELRAELEALIARRRLGRNDVIFSHDNKPIDHDVFYDQYFARDVREWGGPRITYHGLRHTGATLMLMAGVDLKTVSSIMGHKDIKTTSRYLHLIGSNVTAAAQAYSVKPGATTRARLKVVRGDK